MRSVSQRPLPSVDRLAAFADHVAHWALVFGGTSAKNWLILWLVLATWVIFFGLPGPLSFFTYTSTGFDYTKVISFWAARFCI